MLRRFVSAVLAVALLASPAGAQRVGVGLGIGLGGAGGGGGTPALSGLNGTATGNAATGTVVATPASTLTGCTWSIASQSNFAQASGTGVVTKAATNVTAGSYAPATTCTVTNAAQTITISAPLALTIAAGPATITSLLMGSRFATPTTGLSNTSDGNSNSRIASYNETGATVTKLRTYNVDWRLVTANEVAGSSPISITQTIEYPAGTVTRVTWGGAGSTTISNTGDALAESDELTLATPIPAGAMYWVRTYVSVAAGGIWPQPYIVQYTGAASLGEAQDFATGVDKTDGTAITNVVPAAQKYAYGPIALVATAFDGTPVTKAFVGMGDSRVVGSSDKYDAPATGRGNIGHMGKALAGNFPYLNMGLGGSTASTQPGNMARRLALLAKLKPTHLYVSYSHNDLLAGRSASQIAGDVSTIAGQLKAALPGVKVIWPTDQPSASSSDGFGTPGGQTITASPAGVFTGGASSVRSTFNNMLRAGITNVDYVFDVADLLEVDGSNNLTRDGGLWRSGNGGTGTGYHSTYLGTTGTTAAATTDGTHEWSSTITAPGKGGIYILRDAARAQLGGW
ncbi:SGNH/GDSL hydrolase family protein [Sphingomonas adhaesiva]|uniref:SGNH/GDSL hydrolase family protein n=1 Tax=Sphingomonas adhaesiva TaxID=28212 RepID=UPI002FF5616A